MDNLDGIDKTIASSGNGLDGSDTLIGEEVSADVLSVGSIFAERYKVVSEGKAGGMGVVYRCLDLKLDQEATALKVIHPRLLTSEEALKRFRQEVSISHKLTHASIVRVHDIGSYGGLEYFTMEWLEGVSLRGVIAERKKNRQPFSLEETYEIIHPLAEALQHAHGCTIHRDIKPENIMLSESGRYHLKLMDFGIAKMMSVSQLATTSIQMGTPYYMAPEQKLDTGHVDKRADIYSVGVILFELLTLENTVGPELPSDLNPQLPKEVDDVFRKAVALRPEKRYGEVGELDAALSKIVSAEKGRLHQLEEKEQLKQKAELAEQKEREAAEAEQRKWEEKRKEKELREQKIKEEQEEKEKQRLEAEAQAQWEKQEAAKRQREEEQRREAAGQEEWSERRRVQELNHKRKIKIFIVVILIIALPVIIKITLLKEPPPSQMQVTTIPTAEIGRNGHFIAYDNGTVLDTRTNLMWAERDNGTSISWEDAKYYCARYFGGGYRDWRMPTQQELMELYESTKTNNNFPGGCSKGYRLMNLIHLSNCSPWASDTRRSEIACVNFGNGSKLWSTRWDPDGLYNGRVLPVRSAR